MFSKNIAGMGSILPDQLDDLGDVPGGGFGFGGDALLGDEFDAVIGAEISKRIMGGDDLAPRRRDGRDGAPHIIVEAIEAFQIGGGIGLVGGACGGADADQRIADIADVDLDITDRLPGMRVDAARSMGKPAGAAWRDPGAGDHDDGLGGGGLHQAIHPAFDRDR